MRRIEEVFGCPRVLLPVIHPIGRAEALSAVEIAVAAGVEGVFLINQGMSSEQVLTLTTEIHARHPTLWVGLNLLGSAPAEVLRRGLDACAGRLDGIWSDDAAIDEDTESQPRAQAFLDAREQLGWSGLYFHVLRGRRRGLTELRPRDLALVLEGDAASTTSPPTCRMSTRTWSEPGSSCSSGSSIPTGSRGCISASARREIGYARPRRGSTTDDALPCQGKNKPVRLRSHAVSSA